MINNKINPLKLVNIIIAISFVVHLAIIIVNYTISDSIIETLHSKMPNVMGLCLCLLFVVCYYKGNIFAWWVPICYGPIMFVVISIYKPKALDMWNFIALIFTSYFILIYLLPRYKKYKEFIEADSQLLGVLEMPNCESAYEDENSSSDHKNPMTGILAASVALAMFEISYLYPIEKIPENNMLILVAFLHHSILFVVLFAILFFYRRKSILAWWTAMIHIPLVWLLYILLNPFNLIQFAIAAFIFAIMAGYLIMKYKSYQAYISTEEESAGL